MAVIPQIGVGPQQQRTVLGHAARAAVMGSGPSGCLHLPKVTQTGTCTLYERALPLLSGDMEN